MVHESGSMLLLIQQLQGASLKIAVALMLFAMIATPITMIVVIGLVAIR